MFAKYKRATWLIGISQFSSNQAPIPWAMFKDPKNKNKKRKKKKKNSKTLLGCSQAPEQ